MSVETELYDLLGVTPKATEKEIKQAYRKKALTHHPDKGGDEEEFKKLNVAFEILSDPQKRKVYDRFGKNGLKSSGVVSDDILGSIFGNFFGNMGGLGGIFNMYNNIRNAVRKTPPIIHKYQVELEDLCSRKIVKLRFTRERPCPCTSDKTSCVECSGKGVKVCVRQIGPNMIQQTQSPCDKCSGRGKIFSSCDKCKMGMRELPKTFQLHLTPELENGYKYVFAEEGNQNHDSEPGDFIVVIVYKPHSLFRVTGSKIRHLTCTLKISLKEALCGFKKIITHPDGEQIVIEEKGITTPESDKKIPNRGLSHKSYLKITYEIKFPDKLSQEDKTTLSRVL